MHMWIAIVVGCTLGAVGCGNDRAEPDAPPVASDDRARVCPNARSADAIPQRLDATAPTASWTFTELRSAVTAACGSCHLSPSANGGFSYTEGGLAKVAVKMATALVTQTMPPIEIRASDPAGYVKLGTRLQAWIAAGSPETGDFPLPYETLGTGQQLAPAIAEAMTDLGDCVPLPEVVGHDAERDRWFATATALPAQLSDTDLVSLDAYVLAQRGTVAFDVEYPLWADNAHKGRWVHVPSVVDARGVATRQPITFDPSSGRFQIPDNTRFYKTFFKQVKETDGAIRYRKVETRLIVVRHAPATPLFGTYVWDASETAAALHTLPYRDGKPFRDLVLSLETDATTHTQRAYAVPGANRCSDCHQGSESDSFVLGFTPIQLNRRAIGEAGRDTATAPDELSQLQRLGDYGVIAGLAPATAPRLENAGGTRSPRNLHELRFQGYATGNCGHCHNPKGFAFKQGIESFTLVPGGVFQFPLGVGAKITSPQASALLAAGNPAASMFYEHASQPTHLSGSAALLHMPLHTPGIDCNLVQKLGKWIISVPKGTSPTPRDIELALAAADAYTALCPADTVTWLEEDFSDPPVYAPRRADWSDPQFGIPPAIRALELTDGLRALADAPTPTGYWTDKTSNGVPVCRFPELPAPPGGVVLPWMVNPDGSPRRPFGEIYTQKPGAYFFSSVCNNCHGDQADGNTALAKTIAALSGGGVRVANLRAGLVGHHAANLALFDVAGPGGTRNLAGNYLIWMASGGTKVRWPPGLGEYLGSQGDTELAGNMLYQVRRTCARVLPGSAQQAQPSAYAYDVVYKTCTFDNPITDAVVNDPTTHLPVNSVEQNAWLERAARNAAWTIFRYLQVDVANGNFPLGVYSCDLVYPAP